MAKSVSAPTILAMRRGHAYGEKYAFLASGPLRCARPGNRPDRQRRRRSGRRTLPGSAYACRSERPHIDTHDQRSELTAALEAMVERGAAKWTASRSLGTNDTPFMTGLHASPPRFCNTPGRRSVHTPPLSERSHPSRPSPCSPPLRSHRRSTPWPDTAHSGLSPPGASPSPQSTHRRSLLVAASSSKGSCRTVSSGPGSSSVVSSPS